MSSYTSDLKIKIRSILSEAGIAPDYIERVLNGKTSLTGSTADKIPNMQLFVRAFAHSSLDEDNYELFEFDGDTICNSFIVTYIRDKFPQINRVGYLARLKSNLISSKVYAGISERAGFADFVRYAESYKDDHGTVRPSPVFEEFQRKSGKIYRSILEDVFEAFIGITKRIMRSTPLVDGQEGVYEGTALQGVHCILRSLLDKTEISIRYEDVYDPVSRLKQIYDATWGSKFGQNSWSSTTTGSYIKWTVYWWPELQRGKIIQNPGPEILFGGRKVFMTHEGDANLVDKQDVKQELAAMALKKLLGMGFREYKKSMFEHDKFKWKRLQHQEILKDLDK